MWETTGDALFHWRKSYYGLLWTHIWVKSILMLDLFHLLSSPDVNWWTGVVWVIVMFLSDSHSDGTHSLQSIHCWDTDAVIHFYKPDEETNSSWSLMNWGWGYFYFQMWIYKSSSMFWTLFSVKCESWLTHEECGSWSCRSSAKLKPSVWWSCRAERSFLCGCSAVCCDKLWPLWTETHRLWVWRWQSVLKGIVHFEIKMWYLSAYPQGHPRCRCLFFFSRSNFDVFRSNRSSLSVI